MCRRRIAADAALPGNQSRVDVVRAVDHDGPIESHVVVRIEPDQPLRSAVLADVGIRRDVGAARAGVRTRVVGEALEVAGVVEVRALAVGDEPHVVDLPAFEVDEIEAPLTRSEREVDQADLVAPAEVGSMGDERRARFGEQRRLGERANGCRRCLRRQQRRRGAACQRRRATEQRARCARSHSGGSADEMSSVEDHVRSCDLLLKPRPAPVDFARTANVLNMAFP